MKIIKIISEIKNRPPIKLVKIREIRGEIFYSSVCKNAVHTSTVFPNNKNAENRQYPTAQV